MFLSPQRDTRNSIAEGLRESAGVRIAPAPWKPVGGGCIHAAFRVESGDGPFFLKLDQAQGLPLLAAEFEGLTALAATGCVRVPLPVAVCATQTHACLLTEWIDLRAGGPAAGAALGRQLARLHQHHDELFGWPGDNFLGSTAQPNGQRRSWPRFFGQRRLGFQLHLAAANGFTGLVQERGERLIQCLPALLSGHAPSPSLIHGDLWGGNWAVASDGAPVIFDPAVHRADRECDLAMAALFGGFPATFFAAYADAWPLDEGHLLRRDLYQLYHVLNHLNLFGAGYLQQAETLLDRLLAEVEG